MGVGVCAWLAACGLGCVAGSAEGGAASKPVMVFPSRDDLAKLPTLPPLPEAFGTSDVPVDAWSFESPATTDGATYEDASPWGEIARELAKAHPSTTALSASMRCTAQELARFHVAKHAMPTESLRRFMAARCGAASAAYAPAVWSVTLPTPTTDEELAPKARDGFAKMLAARLERGHHLLGVAAARDGQRVSIVAVDAQDEARLEPGSLSVDASRQVTLRGEVRGEFTQIGALINRGDVGTAPCVSDPTIKPPRFALTCTLASGDPFAWVEILGHRRDQLLLHELAEALVHEGDGSAITYAPRHIGPPAPVAGTADFARAMLGGLNAVRTRAHLPALALAPEQSAENTRLAGTLLDAAVSGDDGTSNRGAIGLMAGWDVKGLVRNSTFYLSASPTNDATAWLDFALERPMGRSSLLDPDSRLIAIGPAIPPGGGALGAAVTTYALFGSDDHGAEATRLFQRVAAARKARGVAPPVRVKAIDEMDAELARVAQDGKPAMTALHAAMQAVVSRTGEGVQGWLYETNDLDRADIPAPLLAPGVMQLMMGVTHHRAEGAAWGQYVVFVIAVGARATPGETASL